MYKVMYNYDRQVIFMKGFKKTQAAAGVVKAGGQKKGMTEKDKINTGDDLRASKTGGTKAKGSIQHQSSLRVGIITHAKQNIEL